MFLVIFNSFVCFIFLVFKNNCFVLKFVLKQFVLFDSKMPEGDSDVDFSYQSYLKASKKNRIVSRQKTFRKL